MKAGTPRAVSKERLQRFCSGVFARRQMARLFIQTNPEKYEVYVRPFPPQSSGHDAKWQISNSGGTSARWSRTRPEIVYQSGDQLMAVSYIANGDTFVAERPRVWINKLGGTQWDLAPDGKRVLVLTPVESAGNPKQQHEVVFLINFFDELRRRVPVSK